MYKRFMLEILNMFSIKDSVQYIQGLCH